MTPDQFDERLTAYALADPGLTPDERDAVTAQLAADPAARHAVAEIQALAGVLTAGLAAEQTAAPAVPLTLAPKPSRRRWAIAAAAVAALVVVGLAAIPQVQKARESAEQAKREQEDIRDVRPKGMIAIEELSASETSALRPSGPAWTPEGHSVRGRPAAGGPGVPGGPQALPPADYATLPGSGIYGNGGGVANAPGLGGGIGGGIGGGGPPGGVPGGRGLTGGIPGAGGPGGPGAPGGQPVASPTPADGRPDPNGRGADRKLEARELADRAKSAGMSQAERAVLDKLAQGDAKPEPTAGESKSDEDAYKSRPASFGRLGDGGHGAGDRFPRLVENDFVTVAGLDALSTFGADVDTASYSIVRNHVLNGQLPPAGAVRLEEIVNYFPYGDKAPENDDPFAVTVEVATCPWQPNHRLARIGLKAKPIAVDKRPPSNLVFLIDVSGSMQPENRLPLVKQSLKLLVNQLGENDRVAMVVYAGNSGLVLDSTSATNKQRILEALDRLEAGGSTNGAGGMQQAYDVAARNFIKGGTNRVILCTDGDWNVGTTSTEALVKLVEDKRQTGVFLSVFGFGMGNLRDEMLVKLAGKGNGNYGYVDTLREANKALVEQLSGTLVTVAKDVKLQVEFNPAAIKAYRLLGYEKRILAAADFANDKKDAGEMGAGHVVTALYELVPAGEQSPPDPAEGLRYQPKAAPAAAVKADKVAEAFVVKMRHKKPDGDTSVLRELPVSNVSKPAAQASDDFRFSAAAASFALVLRESQHKGAATFALTADLAGGATKHDPSGYRAEFLDLVKRAQRLSGKP